MCGSVVDFLFLIVRKVRIYTLDLCLMIKQHPIVFECVDTG